MTYCVYVDNVLLLKTRDQQTASRLWRMKALDGENVNLVTRKKAKFFANWR